jgi:hypothetical protein
MGGTGVFFDTYGAAVFLGVPPEVSAMGVSVFNRIFRALYSRGRAAQPVLRKRRRLRFAAAFFRSQIKRWLNLLIHECNKIKDENE